MNNDNFDNNGKNPRIISFFHNERTVVTYTTIPSLLLLLIIFKLQNIYEKLYYKLD